MADNKIYKNYFDPKSVAKRYARGRPQYHSFIVDKIKKHLKVQNKYVLALDVGCGTGFSSVALEKIAENVVSIDMSAEMIRQANKNNKVQYAVASAEKLPLAENRFDLITISQAIHWIDRRKFFAEAERVLKPKSTIIAYDNYYRGVMVKDENFNKWHKEKFFTTFPTPPRERKPFRTKSDNPKDFILVREDWHENQISFKKRELIDYLITISNVINFVENGKKTIEEVKDWLNVELSQFFDSNESVEFEFIAPVWYFQQGN